VPDEPLNTPGPEGNRPDGEPDNRALDTLILNAHDDRSRLVALRALVEATVLLPGHLGLDGLSPPTPFELQGPRGAVYPFFTSRALMPPFVRSIPEPRPVVTETWIPCRELLATAVGHNMNLVFNPLTRLSGEISVDQASDLLAGRVPGTQRRVVDHDQMLRTAEPAQRPPRLVEAIGDLCRSKPFVERVYLRWVVHPDGLQGYLLIFVSDQPHERTVDGLAGLDPFALSGGRVVDAVTVVPTRDLGPIADAEPIYRGPFS
jgi:hypothetical protein